MVRAEGMCQLGKNLHCDHDNSISVPRTHLKKSQAHVYNPNTGKTENKQTVDSTRGTPEVF